MDAPFVALDLGNGRIKAGRFAGDGQLERSLSLEYDRAETELADWVALGGVPSSAAASIVCGPTRAEPVFTALERTLGLTVQRNPRHGLRLDVDSPETVGLDRLYAARGAMARGLDAAIVIDVGTAMTVDAVRRSDDPQRFDAVFLGGAIAPGPALIARSLAGADQLYEVSPSPAAPALGRDTRAALEAGVVHTVAGAAVRLAAGVRSESGLENATLVVTGGARSFVSPALDQAGWSPIDAPHLVLEGLLACRGQATS